MPFGGLQYGASHAIPDTGFLSIFYLQMPPFLSGADGIRTHTLRREKADLSILARSRASGISKLLQVFCTITDSPLSAAY